MTFTDNSTTILLKGGMSVSKISNYNQTTTFVRVCSSTRFIEGRTNYLEATSHTKIASFGSTEVIVVSRFKGGAAPFPANFKPPSSVWFCPANFRTAA